MPLPYAAYYTNYFYKTNFVEGGFYNRNLSLFI